MKLRWWTAVLRWFAQRYVRRMLPAETTLRFAAVYRDAPEALVPLADIEAERERRTAELETGLRRRSASIQAACQVGEDALTQLRAEETTLRETLATLRGEIAAAQTSRSAPPEARHATKLYAFEDQARCPQCQSAGITSIFCSPSVLIDRPHLAHKCLCGFRWYSKTAEG